jgi:hypothetical protein
VRVKIESTPIEQVVIEATHGLAAVPRADVVSGMADVIMYNKQTAV